jgi:hypothetical protein
VAIKAECEENSGGDQFDAFCALLVPTTFLAFDRRGQRVYMDVWGLRMLGGDATPDFYVVVAG